MFDGFLLGVITTCSFAASAFFLRFWRRTRDPLFIGFSAAFLIEGCSRMGFLFVESPQAGNSLLYVLRFVSYFVILLAIANKNRHKHNSS